MLDLRTDEELMAATQRGDDDAFRTLTLRLRGCVARFLRHMGCPDATIDDLAQETLLRLWAARERYQPNARLRTYVLTIARNLWLTECKRAGGGQAGRLLHLSKLHAPDLQDRALAWAWQVDGPEYRLLRRYEAFRIRQAIAALPETQRVVFVLAHIEDLGYAEIAQMLGIAEGTVKSRMHRAVKNLRAALDGEL